MTRSSQLPSTDIRCCMFCRGPVRQKEPVEHIVPEGIGGGHGAVLDRGQVCGRCNGRLSRVDAALCEALRDSRPWFVRELKKKRRPRFAKAIFGDVRLVADAEAVRMTMSSMEPGSPESWSTKGWRLEPTGAIAIDLPARFDCGASRGLHKIALEVLCDQYGTGAALRSMYDPVRHFVLDGVGVRRVLVVQQPERWGFSPTPHMEFGWIGKAPGLACVIGLCGHMVAVSLLRDSGAIRRMAVRWNVIGGLGSCEITDERGRTSPP